MQGVGFRERALWIIPVVLLLGLLVRLDWQRTAWTQDEADLASAAVAMTARPSAWLRPDYHPFGPGANEHLGNGLVAPPLAPALMALPGVLGLRAAWAWPLAGGGLLLFGIAALVRALVQAHWLRIAGAIAVVVLLAPRVALDALTLEAEVPLAGLGAWALALALSPRASTRMGTRAFGSGALLGAAFLCKLWLVAPIALAVLLVWASRRDTARVRTLGAFAAGGLVVAGAHLAIVALLDPASLGRWVSEVYFAAFGSSGVASTKWSGVAAHPEWRHGAWYYPAAIVRELAFAAPAAAVAAYHLLRASGRSSLRCTRVRAAFVGLAIGLLALSAPSIKEPLYVLTIVAVGVAFAARFFVLAARSQRFRRFTWAMVAASGVVAVLCPHPAAFSDARAPHEHLARGR